MTTTSEVCPHCKQYKLFFIPGGWGRVSSGGDSAARLPGHYSCKNCGYYREDEVVVAMLYHESKVTGASRVVRADSVGVYGGEHGHL